MIKLDTGPLMKHKKMSGLALFQLVMLMVGHVRIKDDMSSLMVMNVKSLDVCAWIR